LGVVPNVVAENVNTLSVQIVAAKLCLTIVNKIKFYSLNLSILKANIETLNFKNIYLRNLFIITIPVSIIHFFMPIVYRFSYIQTI